MGSPNIIFILVDDLGDHELSCAGNTFNETPHINALARGGMTFYSSLRRRARLLTDAGSADDGSRARSHGHH